MRPLDKRRLLVVGGNSGIGYATANLAVELGASVFLVGRDQQKLNDAIGALERATGDTGDVRIPKDCNKNVSSAAKFLGGIDCLVFSAGTGEIKNIEEMEVEKFREIVDINLVGAFNVCKAILPYLKKSSRPNIILLGSRAGRYAFEGGVAYCAAKFGMQGFAESLFLDVRKYGIPVTLVAPGTVNTGFSNVKGQEWQLHADDIAEVICNCLMARPKANVNWVEVRPTESGVN